MTSLEANPTAPRDQSHLGELALRRFSVGEFSSERCADVDRHISACSLCRNKLRAITDEQRDFQREIPFDRFAGGVERARRVPRSRPRSLWSVGIAGFLAAAAVAVFFVGVNLYRGSIKFRVTNTVIETERGFLSKRIDVLQLWRCRDVRYKQNLIDRILGIAHVEIVASDATNPDLEIVGMPASRQLFEQLRDSIEIQRQAKNVYGVVS